MLFKWLQFSLKIALTFVLLTIELNNAKPQSQAQLYRRPVIDTSSATSEDNYWSTNRRVGGVSIQRSIDRTLRFVDSTENDSNENENNYQRNIQSEIVMPDIYSRQLQSSRIKSQETVDTINTTNDSIGVVREPNGHLKIVYPTRKTNQIHHKIVAEKINASPESRFKDSFHDDINKNNLPFVRGKRGTDSDIVFPDDPIPVPRCRPGELFCTDVSHYPNIDNLLRHDGHKYDAFFGDDYVTHFNLTQRIDAPGEESMCESVEDIMYPKLGLTSDDKWRFIINSGNYTQGIRIETCVTDKSPCKYANSFPNGYTAKCQQKYIYRHLVSLNEHGRPDKDLFKIPSCCKCILKFEPSKR